MKNDLLLTQLTAALADYLPVAEDVDTQMQQAYKAYFSDTSNEEARDNVFAVGEIKDKARKPVIEILTKAHTAAFKAASDNGLFGKVDQGPAATIIDEIWKELREKGWKSMPAYRHKDLADAFNELQISVHLKGEGLAEKDPAATAEAILKDIKAGTVQQCRGSDDIFKNFNDGVHLTISMENWAPVLRCKDDKGRLKTPTGGVDDLVFCTEINFPTGRVLVADFVHLGTLHERSNEMRRKHRLCVNYAKHRVLAAVISVMELNLLDISVGDDGPGLVRAEGSDLIFAGDPDEEYTEIANVCHDRSTTAMIDRKFMVDILVEDGKTEAEANAEIDAWIEEKKFRTEIEIPAGEWIVYFDDDREALQKRLKQDGIKAPEDTRFVLSQKPLKLSPNRKIEW